MKFDLTIKDLTAGQARKLFEVLNADAVEDVEVAQVTTPEKAVEIAKAATLPPAPPAPQTAPQHSIIEVRSETPSISQMVVGLSDTDTDGLPWDERVHSSNKQKTAKGVWRRKRGVQDAQYEVIKAELLSNPQPPVQAAPTATMTPPPVPQAVATPPVPATFIPPAPPQTVPLAQAPSDVAPTLNPPVRDFAAVLNRVQRGFQTGKCNPAYIPTLVERLKLLNPNVTAVTDITGNDELISAVHNMMDGDGIE